MAQARSAVGTDRENKVNKMFIIIMAVSKLRNVSVRTGSYGMQINQP
jgi:hypothetical protein